MARAPWDLPDRLDGRYAGPLPVAPSAEEWLRLTPDERARHIEEINTTIRDLQVMSEGTPHSRAKRRAADTLESHFSRIKKGVFIAEELSVLYPGEPVFVPDLLAVLDVPLHDRNGWVVVDEGKGPDVILEITNKGRLTKDVERNVERYGRLGIPEYFVYDCLASSLRGFRLPGGGANRYAPILPQAGRFPSLVLGLELAVVEGRLRFFKDEAEIPASADLVERLSHMVDEREERIQAAEAQAQVAQGQAQAAERATRTSLREALVAVLDARRLPVSEEQRATIAACDEPAVLARWITRAATASSTAEALGTA